jgi:hypothetical protein
MVAERETEGLLKPPSAFTPTLILPRQRLGRNARNRADVMLSGSEALS